MIPRHLFRLARGFSSIRKNRSPLFKFSLIYFSIAFCIVGGYATYSTMRVDRPARARRYKHVDELMKKKREFSGVERGNIKEELLKLFEESEVVVLFGPSFQGKTELVNFLAQDSKLVHLTVQNTFEETINFWGYEDKYEETQFNEFMGLLEYMATKEQGMILVLDQFEKIPDMYKIRIADCLQYWSDNKKMKILIVTNSEKDVHIGVSLLKSKVYCLPDMTESEFFKCFQGENRHSEYLIRALWEKFGFDLEYSKEVLSNNKSLDVFLNEKKKYFGEKINEIDENLLKNLKKSMDFVDSQRPLGDIFKGSKLGTFLLKIGAGKSYIGSVKFRNLFVVEAFKEHLTGK